MKRSVKWVFTGIAIIIYLIMGSIIPAIPLTNKSIVIGFGVDLVGERMVEVSAQILIPSDSEGKKGQGDTIVVKATSSTVTGALEDISKKTGSAVSLTHCYSIFLGESIVAQNYTYSILNNLLENTYLSENVFLLMAEGKASEILEAKLAFKDSASYYTRQIMDEDTGFNAIAVRTVQEFIVNYHSFGATNWLPIVKLEKTEKAITAEGGGGEEPEYVLDFSSSGIFIKNKLAGIVDEKKNMAINYVMLKPKKGSVMFTGDNGVEISLRLLKSSVKKSYDLDKKLFKVELEIKSMIKDIVDYSGEDLYVDRIRLTENEIALGAASIKKDIEELYQDTVGKGADVFDILERFYSKYGKRASNLTVQEIAIEVTVKLLVGV